MISRVNNLLVTLDDTLWWINYCIAGYFRRRNFQTSATILNFKELNFTKHHDFENKFSFLLWTNKSFVEFIFEDNMLNEIFENKFPLKITRYTVVLRE